MKIYLASKFALKEKVDTLSKYLILKGHTITCVWWKDDVKHIGCKNDHEWYNLPIIKHICARDFAGVDNADTIILVSDIISTSFNGANVELGYAISKGKKIIIFGKVDRNALYSNVIFCDTLDQLEAVLSD